MEKKTKKQFACLQAGIGSNVSVYEKFRHFLLFYNLCVQNLRDLELVERELCILSLGGGERGMSESATLP